MFEILFGSQLGEQFPPSGGKSSQSRSLANRFPQGSPRKPFKSFGLELFRTPSSRKTKNLEAHRPKGSGWDPRQSITNSSYIIHPVLGGSPRLLTSWAAKSGVWSCNGYWVLLKDMQNMLWYGWSKLKNALLSVIVRSLANVIVVTAPFSVSLSAALPMSLLSLSLTCSTPDGHLPLVQQVQVLA